MFFVWGKMHTQEQKLGRFSHKKRAHTHTHPGLLSRVERRNEREREGDEVYKQ